MPKVPLKKEGFGTPTAGVEGNTQEALNRLGQRPLDQQPDGKLYRKLLGVNYDHQLTNSGIADSTITAEKILTVSGSSLLTGTVPVAALAPCNQFAVYRDAAFTCPAGAFSNLYANRVLKDSGSGWSQANAWYTLPADGDYWFSWSVGATITNTSRNVTSRLLVNSGQLTWGSQYWSATGASNYSSVGSYLYVNGKAGDRVVCQIFNGDTVTSPLLVTSGHNHFSGYQLR